jgi:GTP cyclohydrolase I/GTP cyclohydrolase-4
MKRSDEVTVVEKEQRNPRFVEDCVREMVRALLEAHPELPDDAFLMTRQENFETIHRHNVVAERYGTIGEIRAEIAGGDQTTHHRSMTEWLAGEAGQL